ncbi:putative flavin-binding monooxygenase protein [Lasiodiplodia theobromae]|nr:putative flavin-binding monooxygenase protein [Lasiodiplodia theobromae]
MTAARGQNGFASPVISERLIDEPRPLKVIYIGAGVSGIVGAIQLRKMVPTIELVIYPGCACDVPSHSYQLSFESSTDWSQFYASAPEILAYWKRVARKYDVERLVRFQHKCVEARWDAGQSKWSVKLQKLDRSDGADLVEDTADVLMTGTGVLNEWRWPDIKGLHDFKGDLLHSANWNDAFDPKIVPALAGKVRSMDHYIRGKTWITNQIGEEFLKERTWSGSGNFEYTSEEKAVWKQDPAAYVQYRKSLELKLQGNYAISQRGDPSRAQATRASFEQQMRDRLQAKPELISHLIPDFPPFCKRLTPGPGYLEALSSSPAVTVIPTPISHVDATGIWTADGTTHRPVDAIICATGFDTSSGSVSFPIYGRDSATSLRAKYAAAGATPRTYLGLCTDGFPNFFHALGPNSFQGAGNLLVTIEAAHATVYTADCLSWYKSAPPGASVEERKRGRVTALWPGSSVHALHALSEVRWEDFEVESCGGNEFAWFGNGWTVADRSGVAEGLTWYIRDGGLAGS